MALSLVFARQARRDLEGILSYIAAENPGAAKKMSGRLDETLRLLVEKPFIGAAARGLGDTALRRFSVTPYIVFYLPQTSTLEVVRILHSSMDLTRPGLFKRSS